MKHIIFAHELFYKFVEVDGIEQFKFCVAYGNRCWDIENHETVYYTDRLPITNVWRENKNGDFILNLPNKLEQIDYNLLPKFIDKNNFKSFKLDVNELADMEKNFNKILKLTQEQLSQQELKRILMSNYNVDTKAKFKESKSLNIEM